MVMISGGVGFYYWGGVRWDGCVEIRVIIDGVFGSRWEVWLWRC